MTLDEIIKYVNTFERKGNFSDILKYRIMKSVVSDYRENHTFFGHCLVSESIVQSFSGFFPETLQDQNEPLLLPDREEDQHPHWGAVRRRASERVREKWIVLMEYLADKKNIGKTLHTAIKKNLEEYFLNSHISIRYETKHTSDPLMHRLKSIEHSIFGAVQRDRFNDFNLLDFTTAVVTSPATLIKGCINAASRNPLNIAEQKALFNKLESINNDEDKIAIINRINQAYKKNNPYFLLFFSNQSRSSLRLTMTLNKDASPLEQKWAEIVSYLTEADGDSLLNNGKELFNCIHGIVNVYDLSDHAISTQPPLQT